jgi:hypothetical protein
MDEGGKESKQIQEEGEEADPLQRYISNVSDVFSPLWVRRFIQVNDGFNWLILGCRYRFLFNFRMFLVVLYLAYETFK